MRGMHVDTVGQKLLSVNFHLLVLLRNSLHKWCVDSTLLRILQVTTSVFCRDILRGFPQFLQESFGGVVPKKCHDRFLCIPSNSLPNNYPTI
jgi:hypothetical protein